MRFAGNKSILITAIQQDEFAEMTIFDESSDTWGFARSTPSSSKRLTKFDLTTTVETEERTLDPILNQRRSRRPYPYFMINYSKTIDFGWVKERVTYKSLGESRRAVVRVRDGEGSGEGAGDGSGDGDGDGSDEQGYAELNALLKKRKKRS